MLVGVHSPMLKRLNTRSKTICECSWVGVCVLGAGWAGVGGILPSLPLIPAHSAKAYKLSRTTFRRTRIIIVLLFKEI